MASSLSGPSGRLDGRRRSAAGLWGSGGASPYASPATAALMALGGGDASGTNWAELQVEGSFHRR